MCAVSNTFVPKTNQLLCFFLKKIIFLHWIHQTKNVNRTMNPVRCTAAPACLHISLHTLPQPMPHWQEAGNTNFFCVSRSRLG